MNTVKMKAYCGDAVYQATVRSTEEGVQEYRESVLEDLFIVVPENGDPIKHTLLIAIPGGKA